MDKVFSSIFGGDKKKKMPTQGGHILGGGTAAASASASAVPSPPPPPATRRLDITFCGQSLGIHVTQGAGGGVVVKQVEPNSEASRAGVKAGFQVCEFEGQAVGSCEAFVAACVASDRPCRIAFDAPAHSQQQQRAPQQEPPAGRGGGGSGGAEERRAAALAAAEARGNGGGDSSLRAKQRAQLSRSKAQQAKLAAAGSEAQRHRVTAASAAAFEAAKEEEARANERLGYNPYQPIFGSAAQGRSAVARVNAGEAPPLMSSSSSAAASSAAAAAAAQPLPRTVDRNHPAPPASSSAWSPPTATDGGSGTAGGGSGGGHGSGGGGGARSAEEEEEEAAFGPLGEALALLVSQPEGAAALGTVLKVLSNLERRFNEEKFHTIRLHNKAFHDKVAGVAGGLELMQAAGFELRQETEAVLVYPMLPAPAPAFCEALAHLRRLCATKCAN